MKLEQFKDYYAAKQEEGLSKMDVSFEEDTEINATYVVKTKETYVFECEGVDEENAAETAADEKIDSVRLLPGFVEAKKKFKAGKENKKTGEVKEPGKYTVIITLTH